jgi:hypothetical protein
MYLCAHAEDSSTSQFVTIVMKGVTVKSLFNETWEVATTEQGTVGDVLEQLATADTRLAAAALLFRVRNPASPPSLRLLTHESR